MKRTDLIAIVALPIGVFFALVFIGVLFVAVGVSKCVPFEGGGVCVERNDAPLVRLGATALAMAALTASTGGET